MNPVACALLLLHETTHNARAYVVDLDTGYCTVLPRTQSTTV